jgi:hypothetical protein
MNMSLLEDQKEGQMPFARTSKLRWDPMLGWLVARDEVKEQE